MPKGDSNHTLTLAEGKMEFIPYNHGDPLTEHAIQETIFPDMRLEPSKPLLKWAGGKTQLLPILRSAVPASFNRYVEPFVGGGAFYWDLALRGSLIADSNAELMHFYSIVRDFPQDFMEVISQMEVTKDNFYRMRSMTSDSMNPIQRAARFLFLNKTCYNGLHRVNRRGQFNTPFGGKTNVAMFEERDIIRAANLLRTSLLICADYRDLLPELKAGDFVYFDPPYLPIGKYSDFRRYTSDFFSEQDHENLADSFSQLADRGIKALLSNSFNATIECLYRGHWYKLVQANRQINCRPSGRGKLSELLVANYPAKDFSVLS